MNFDPTGVSAALQPLDEHNRRLQAHVHPPDWVNPTPRGGYQLVVIGAGTAGLVTAAAAAGLGARVALVERALMGGDCLNVGCVPSKAIIRAARAAAACRDAARFGITLPQPPRADFAEVMARMRRLRAAISPHDSARRFQQLGVDVFFGQAEFAGAQLLRVIDGEGTVRELPFRRAVIATGARAAVPEIPGLAEVPYLTNETLFSLTTLPASLGVIGGGPIGCEMAQTFARLGSRVTLVEKASQILPREDPDAAAVVQRQFEQDGVQVILEASQLQVTRQDSPAIALSLAQAGVPRPIAVDQLLVAAGRAPNIEGLNLQAAGVTHDRRGVHVDDYLRTSNPRIFAAGDVCSRYKFTHAADFQARIVVQNALFALGPLGRKKVSRLLVPWATYTSPEVAHVGSYPGEAAAAGLAVDTYVQPLEQVDRALLDGEEAGFVKIHTRKGADRIVGATIVAHHAGDLISQITLAMNQRIGLGQIAATIHPYPTQAEAIRKLGDQYNRTRLTPLSQRALNALRWLNVGSSSET